MLPFWAGSGRAFAVVITVALLAVVVPLAASLIRVRPMGRPDPAARLPGDPSGPVPGRWGSHRFRRRHASLGKRRRTARPF